VRGAAPAADGSTSWIAESAARRASLPSASLAFDSTAAKVRRLSPAASLQASARKKPFGAAMPFGSSSLFVRRRSVGAAA